jgi:hypothetical protein
MNSGRIEVVARLLAEQLGPVLPKHWSREQLPGHRNDELALHCVAASIVDALDVDVAPSLVSRR